MIPEQRGRKGILTVNLGMCFLPWQRRLVSSLVGCARFTFTTTRQPRLK